MENVTSLATRLTTRLPIPGLLASNHGNHGNHRKGKGKGKGYTAISASEGS